MSEQHTIQPDFKSNSPCPEEEISSDPLTDPYLEDCSDPDTDPDEGMTLQEALQHPVTVDAMSDWKIDALGRRPIDYAVRDLLLGSMWREPRATWFRRIVCEPPDWMRKLVDHLPKGDRVQALQLVALRFLYVHHLGVLRGDPLLSETQQATLKKISACWPLGALMKWTGRGRKSQKDVCRQAWHCPWCQARNAMTLYNNLIPTLPRRIPRSDNHLLIVLNTILMPRYTARHEYVAHQYPDISVPEREIMLCGRDLVTQETLPTLRYFATESGIRGGILVHQIAPQLTPDGDPGFAHELQMLGEVECSTPEEFDCLMETLCVSNDKPLLLGVAENYGAFIGARLLPANWHWFSLLLFGSSRSYPIWSLPMDFSVGDRYSRDFPYGIPGALSLQPIFLFSRDQWRDYFEATRNQRMYRTFGTWMPSVAAKGLSTKNKGTNKGGNSAVNQEIRITKDT